jgi:RNA polymerase sigma-70 factor, ECF subfamily
MLNLACCSARWPTTNGCCAFMDAEKRTVGSGTSASLKSTVGARFEATRETWFRTLDTFPTTFAAATAVTSPTVLQTLRPFAISAELNLSQRVQTLFAPERNCCTNGHTLVRNRQPEARTPQRPALRYLGIDGTSFTRSGGPSSATAINDIAVIPMTAHHSISANTLDQSSFDRIMHEHAPTIVRLANRLTHNADNAQDVVQEVLLKLYTDGKSVRTSLAGWIQRVTRNACIDHHRRRYTGRNLQFEEWLCLCSTGPTPEEYVLQGHQRRVILAALRKLTPAERRAIVLRHVHDLSAAQVARLTGAMPSTIRVQVHAARTKLKKLLLAETRSSDCERNRNTCGGSSQ